MGYITTSGHHSSRHHHTIAAAFWIVVGVVAVIAFGDTLTLLAVALAIVTTAWWISGEVKLRAKSNDARDVGSRGGH
jgi:hypothetical protein